MAVLTVSDRSEGRQGKNFHISKRTQVQEKYNQFLGRTGQFAEYVSQMGYYQFPISGEILVVQTWIAVVPHVQS